MFRTLKKQVLILILASGVIAPVLAIDSHQESSGWFGWKSVAGITLLVGAGALWAYYGWIKPAPKRPVSKKSGTKVTKQQEEQEASASSVVNSNGVKSSEELTYEKNLAEFKPEFVTTEMKRLETLIAQLEREIAQEPGK